MKKLLAMILTLVFILALTGCDSMPGSSTGGSSGGSGSVASSTDGYPDEDGFATGYMGTAMHTAFFDYTVNSAQLATEYNGYTPAEGNQVLVVDVTIKNTDTESIPMFDTDFQAQWGEDADDAFSNPILDVVDENQLPEEYHLAIQEERTGLLIYEVPTGYEDFSVSYMEIYNDDSTGNTFFVYFTPDAPASV